MEICILAQDNQSAIYDDVLRLLYTADREFLPPLSERSSSTQQNFLTVPETGNGVVSYFENLKKQRFVAAWESGQLLGFVSFREDYLCHEIPSEELPNIYISTLIVAPEARGKGVTAAMYQTLFQQYTQRNIFTRTWSANAAHIRILERFGFSTWRVLKNDRGNGIDTVYFKRARA